MAHRVALEIYRVKENIGDLWSGTGDREIAIGAWTYRCRTRRLASEQYRVSRSSMGHLEGRH